MILTQAYAYSVDEVVLEKLNNHSRKQESLGKYIWSTIIPEIQIYNWFDKEKNITFMCALMSV